MNEELQQVVYLKAQDEASFITALKECGWAWDDEYEEIDGESVLVRESGIFEASSNHVLSVIGTVFVRTGNTVEIEVDDYDDTTTTVPEMVAVDGYHANLLLRQIELPTSLEPLVIDAPSNPCRLF